MGGSGTFFLPEIESVSKKGITGKELGEILGLKKSPLTDWKNEKAKPSIEQAIKICEICAISIEWLLTGKEAGDLDPEEQELVNLYRRADERGKRRIRQTAELESQEESPPEVSASKIG